MIVTAFDPAKLKEQMQRNLVDGQTLAKMCNVSDTTVYNVLAGRQRPKTSTVKSFCEALGCTPADLLKEV